MPVTTTMNLTTATTTRESAFLHQNGDILDHRIHQAKDVSRVSTSREDENWAAASMKNHAPLATSESMDETDFVPISRATVSNKSSVAKLSPVPPLNRTAGLTYSSDTNVRQIKSGCLEELIHEFVPRAHAVPSEEYQFAFLLSSRLFLTPNRLLSEVYRRADQLAHMLSPESHPAFSQNLVTMLSQWMVWFPSDFRDESMLNRFRQLVRLIVQWHPLSETKLNQLLQTLLTHLSAIDRHDKHLERLEAGSKTSSSFLELVETVYTPITFAQVSSFKL
jgi:hypothetical protein